MQKRPMKKDAYHVTKVDQPPDEAENLIHQDHAQDKAEGGIVYNHKKFKTSVLILEIESHAKSGILV